MFWVIGLKILGRVCTKIYFLISFFLEKNSILCILKGILPFKMHTIIFFPENLIFFYISTVNLGRFGLHLGLNTGIILFGLTC